MSPMGSQLTFKILYFENKLGYNFYYIEQLLLRAPDKIEIYLLIIVDFLIYQIVSIIIIRTHFKLKYIDFHVNQSI